MTALGPLPRVEWECYGEPGYDGCGWRGAAPRRAPDGAPTCVACGALASEALPLCDPRADDETCGCGFDDCEDCS